MYAKHVLWSVTSTRRRKRCHEELDQSYSSRSHDDRRNKETRVFSQKTHSAWSYIYIYILPTYNVIKCQNGVRSTAKHIYYLLCHHNIVRARQTFDWRSRRSRATAVKAIIIITIINRGCMTSRATNARNFHRLRNTGKYRLAGLQPTTLYGHSLLRRGACTGILPFEDRHWVHTPDEHTGRRRRRLSVVLYCIAGYETRHST